ncbi:hypothetical protein AX16_006828 [Volvariella volvacea WC 439]|nr:hypothetical protein AX16_006828 [Volvariella volvacea WC 439]
MPIQLAIAVVLFFYLSGIIVLTGLTIHDYVGEDVIINNELDVLPGCYARAVPAIIGGYWITSVGVESVLFIMVISRAYVWWKEGSSAPRILSLLARDSTIYFAVVFALLLANLFVFRFGPPFLSSLLVTPSSTAGCILGSHMLLNLRAMLDPSSDPDFHKSTIATKIIFVPPPRHRESRNRTTIADEAAAAGGEGATTVRRGGHGNSTVLAGRRDDEDENDDYDYDDDGWDSYHAKYTSRPTRKWSGNPYLGASGVGGPGHAARRQASGSGLNGGASRSPSSPKPTR